MAIIKKYRAEVTRVINRGEGVYTIELKPPERTFKYSPGQFLHIALDEDYDGSGQWPDSRCFSMQSHPDEETLKITYAVKGIFTRQMEQTLQEGLLVWLKMPYGDLFNQEHNKQGTVFIAGGTGITPFLSLFTHGSFAGYHNPVLYLGLRNERYHFYKKELKQAQAINPSLQVHIVYQDSEGVLDIEKILKENGGDVPYFISGPPAMIKAFKNRLVENGVPAAQVLTDDWE